MLTIREGSDGTFVDLLHELGLKEFLQIYPVAKLIEWRWLVPFRRLIFPKAYLDLWEPYIEGVTPKPLQYGEYELLWYPSWTIKNENEPLWFLHPFFRLGEKSEQLLQSLATVELLPAVPAEIHNAGGAIKPYVDYFFRWQAFALVDVIQFADSIGPILNTPDVEERAQRVVQHAQFLVDRFTQPVDVLNDSRGWAGFATLMTWMAHYRSYREAMWFLAYDSPNQHDLLKNGAALLAKHLGVTSEILEEEIKSKLLVLAQNWRCAMHRRSRWIEDAWPCLQKDIQMAMEWLCILSGQPLEHYLELWQHTHRCQDSWAELHTVLPDGYFDDRGKFLSIAPIYLKKFVAARAAFKFQDELDLRNTVDAIRRTNSSFWSLLGAFRRLHDELTTKHGTKNEIDFRARHPLDSYAIVAVRAETCLREKLKQLGKLDSIIGKKQALPRYVRDLALIAGLSGEARGYFDRQVVPLTELHKTRRGVIDNILALKHDESRLRPREHELVQAFLLTCLARNYFAHHSDLDHELLRSENSAFVLGGIVVTVLYLLGGGIGTGVNDSV